MDEKQAFLNAIIDEPDDDALRLIYADWLDDHDEPERAEFIRAQCDLASISIADPRRMALEDRADDLRAAHERDWLGDMDEISLWEWNRGFVEQIQVDTEANLPAACSLFKEHPIRELEVEILEEVSGLSELPFLNRLTRLIFELSAPESEEDEVIQLLASPRCEHLTHLDAYLDYPDWLHELAHRRPTSALVSVVNHQPTPADVQSLMTANALQNVTELSVGVGSIDEQLLKPIESCPERWTGLDYGYSWLTPEELQMVQKYERLKSLKLLWPVGQPFLPIEGLERLAFTYIQRHGMQPSCLQTLRCESLEKLSFVWEPRSEMSWEEEWFALGELLERLPGPCLELTLEQFQSDPLPMLTRLPGLENVRQLNLDRCALTDDGLDDLASCDKLTGLHTLVIWRLLPQEQTARLADASVLNGLRHLDLNGLKIGHHALRELSESSSLRRVQTLSLTNANLTLQGIDALLAWEFPQSLRRLTLRDNRVGDEDREGLRERFGQRLYPS